MEKKPLTPEDLEIIKQISNKKRGCVIAFYLFLIIPISFILNQSFPISLTLTIVGLISFLFFIIEYAGYSTMKYDIMDGVKITGACKVIEKVKYSTSDDPSKIYYLLSFSDYRVGTKSFKKVFWESIEIDNVFYIEHTIHSRKTLSLKFNDVECKHNILLDPWSGTSIYDS